MEFLKNGTTLCPYCKQPLEEGKDKLYCRAENCGKTFEKFVCCLDKESNDVNV